MASSSSRRLGVMVSVFSQMVDGMVRGQTATSSSGGLVDVMGARGLLLQSEEISHCSPLPTSVRMRPLRPYASVLGKCKYAQGRGILNPRPSVRLNISLRSGRIQADGKVTFLVSHRSPPARFSVPAPIRTESALFSSFRESPVLPGVAHRHVWRPHVPGCPG